jgi:hypothetical protein
MLWKHGAARPRVPVTAGFTAYATNTYLRPTARGQAVADAHAEGRAQPLALALPPGWPSRAVAPAAAAASSRGGGAGGGAYGVDADGGAGGGGARPGPIRTREAALLAWRAAAAARHAVFPECLLSDGQVGRLDGPWCGPLRQPALPAGLQGSTRLLRTARRRSWVWQRTLAGVDNARASLYNGVRLVPSLARGVGGGARGRSTALERGGVAAAAGAAKVGRALVSSVRGAALTPALDLCVECAAIAAIVAGLWSWARGFSSGRLATARRRSALRREVVRGLRAQGRAATRRLVSGHGVELDAEGCATRAVRILRGSRTSTSESSVKEASSLMRRRVQSRLNVIDMVEAKRRSSSASIASMWWQHLRATLTCMRAQLNVYVLRLESLRSVGNSTAASQRELECSCMAPRLWRLSRCPCR